MDEVLDRISQRRGGRVGFATAVDDLRAERDARSASAPGVRCVVEVLGQAGSV
jgi:hypothetical protein